MEALQEQIRRIQLKLQEHLKQHAAALKELEKQQKMLATLREQQQTNEERIRQLQEQNHILQAAAGDMNPADKKAFEQAIGRYIREIDKCIALLSE